MKLDSRTSFCTSFAMLSTVPGLGRLSNALRSENEVYASLIAAAAGLSVRNERDDVRSAILDVGRLEFDEGKVSSRDADEWVRRGGTLDQEDEGGIETSPGNLGRVDVSGHVDLQKEQDLIRSEESTCWLEGSGAEDFPVKNGSRSASLVAAVRRGIR